MSETITFTPTDDIGIPYTHPPVTRILVNISNVFNTTSDQPVADLVSNLTVSTEEISIGGIVTCETLQKNLSKLTASINLIIAGAVLYNYTCPNCTHYNIPYFREASYFAKDRICHI